MEEEEIEIKMGIKATHTTKATESKDFNTHEKLRQKRKPTQTKHHRLSHNQKKKRNKREGYGREFKKCKLPKYNSNLSPPKATLYTYHYTKALNLKLNNE